MVPQCNNASLEYIWLTMYLTKIESTIHFDISDFVLTNSRGQYLQKGILEQILYRGPYTYDVYEKFPTFIHPFSNDPCLFCITWKRKQPIEQQPHCACEWTEANQN